MTRVTLAVIATILLISAGVFVAILLARGYEFDSGNHAFVGTGILVATSDPNGAEVLIDGKLKTATNNTINLAPGTYDIKIQLDGFSPWEKKVTIKKEEVYKTNAFLFPKVPNLQPMTYSGALNPTLSPDQTKIAYGVSTASAERSGIWVADMSRPPLTSPLGGSADQRLIYRDLPGLILSDAKFYWSADSKQIIAYYGSTPTLGASSSAQPKTAFLLDVDRLNDSPASALPLIPQLLTDWDALTSSRLQLQMNRLDLNLKNFLTSSASKIDFAPDQTKILYQASASATLPAILQSPIPGRDPTPETRDIKPGNLYVYDLKEDRNYILENCKFQISNCVWFPSSRHILIFTGKEISVMEYDGTNKATVYAGPFIDSIVYAWPNWSKIVILTSLNGATGNGEYLYTINLR